MDDAFFDEDHEPFVGSSRDSRLFWSDEILPAAHFPNTSSFVLYQSAATSCHPTEARPPGPSVNMNKRVIDFARRCWPGHVRNRGLGREKGHRHMMSERMRREKQKQSYSALHSLLPPRTKKDKNSIVQAASTTILDLQRRKEELQRRINTVTASLRVMGLEENNAMGGTKIKARVGNPVSGIDSMLKVLRCLDSLGLETTSLRSKFSSEEFSTVVTIREQTEAAELEEVIQRKLFEAERKLLHKPHGVC